MSIVDEASSAAGIESRVEEVAPRRTLRKQREKEQRVNSILGAAEELFASKGYQGTSIEEIADLAEVSTGTIYFYFKNKEDLLIRLMHSIGYLLRKMLGGGLAESAFSLEDFCAVGTGFVREFCLRYPGKAVILFRESVGQSEVVEEHRKLLFNAVTNDIKGGLEEVVRRQGRRFKSADAAELIATLVVGIYNQLAYHYLIWQDQAEIVMDIADETATFLLAGASSLLAPGRKKGKDAKK
ncbi:MAG: TetR/AcrR family transcriptional regulator [Actinomycetota bacterium]